MIEAEAIDPRKLKVLQLLQCVICLEGVQDARLCSFCSGLFCGNCINNWLSNKSSSCPNCRKTLQYSALIRGYLINQLQDSIRQLFSSMDKENILCDKHVNQHLALYCYSCEVTICVKCWFSQEHAEHKERAVPLEEAFEHYMQSMKTNLAWINGRKEDVDHVLEQVQENLNQLTQEKESIAKLLAESKELIMGKANPATVMQLLKTERAMAELRLNHENKTQSMRLDRGRQLMPEVTELCFKMSEFDKYINEFGTYETKLLVSYGCEWKCKIASDMTVYLTLLAGQPSEYSILCDPEPETVYLFELGSAVKIGIFNPTSKMGNDFQQLTIQVRQSYGDKFEQLQSYIGMLEKENAEHVAFKTYLADYDKRNVPTSS